MFGELVCSDFGDLYLFACGCYCVSWVADFLWGWCNITSWGVAGLWGGVACRLLFWVVF